MFNWIVFSQTTMVMCESWTKHSKRLISLTCELWFLVSINLFSDSSLLHLGATLILTEYEIGYVKLLVGLAQWEKATAVVPCFKSASLVSLLLWDWAVYEKVTQLPTVARPHSQNEQDTRPCTLWVNYSNYSKPQLSLVSDCSLSEQWNITLIASYDSMEMQPFGGIDTLPPGFTQPKEILLHRLLIRLTESLRKSSALSSFSLSSR